MRTVKVRASTAIVIATWRLGSRAPLVARNKKLFHSQHIHWKINLQRTAMERRHVCDFQSIKSRLWFEVISQGTYGNSTCCPAPHWGLYTLSQNIRANSQTNGLERGWKRRVRLRRNARKVRLIRYTKPILRKKKPTVLQSDISVSKHKAVETVIDRKVDLRI